MTFEGQREHFRASFESKSERFRKFTKIITFECDFDEISDVLTDTQYAFCLAKLKFRAERSFIRYQLPVAVDFTSVFDSNGELSFEVDENISDVLFWE